MNETGLRDKTILWLLFIFLFVSVNAGNAAQRQNKTTKKAPSKITLRDLDYETFQAEHPSVAYFGAIYPALSAGKTERRSFRLTGPDALSAPLVVRVTPIIYITGAKPKTLALFEKTLLPFVKARENFTIDFPIPNFNTNVTVEYTLSVRQNKAPLCSLKERFVVIAEGKTGTRLEWLGRDDKTQGDWLGVYGKEAFFVATTGGRSVYQSPSIALDRGLGDAGADKSRTALDSRNAEESEPLIYGRGASLPDKRLLQRGPGQSDKRPPVAFSAQRTPLIFRVEARDGLPHTLSLYVLDFRRVGQVMQADVYDFQRHHLDTRRIENFGEGAYLRYRFSGKIVVVLTSVTPNLPPAAHALFVDP